MKKKSKVLVLFTFLYFASVFDLAMSQGAMVKITLEPNPESLSFFEISMLVIAVLTILFGIFKVVKKKK